MLFVKAGRTRLFADGFFAGLAEIWGAILENTREQRSIYALTNMTASNGIRCLAVARIRGALALPNLKLTTTKHALGR